MKEGFYRKIEDTRQIRIVVDNEKGVFRRCESRDEEGRIHINYEKIDMTDEELSTYEFRGSFKDFGVLT